MKPPKRKPNTIIIQPNRTFDSVDEIRPWLDNNIPGAVITKIWNKSVILCEVEAPEPRKEK